MVDCDYCGGDTEGYAHRCKYCGQVHCSNHLQPESHDCEGLKYRKQENAERWKQTITSSFNRKSARTSEDEKVDRLFKDLKNQRKGQEAINSIKIRPPVSLKKLTLLEKLSRQGIEKYESLKYFLKKRQHSRYNYSERANYFITTILIFAASIVGVTIFYSNALKLNLVRLWIIKLGGVLILISLFFTIKFGWRLGKEIINIFKRQRNWFRYLIILLIAVFLWQCYTNREIVLNPVFEAYNKTNFTLFVPISLDSFSLSSSSSNKPSSGNSEGGWLSKYNRDVGAIEQEILILVNEERQRNGARALTEKNNLNSYARSWSEKMISEGFFEHSNMNFPYPSTAGENIAETPIHYGVVGCGATYTNQAMAKCFVSGWIESPGHHENMISKSFSMTGIGVACDSSKCRATQVFSG